MSFMTFTVSIVGQSQTQGGESFNNSGLSEERVMEQRADEPSDLR